MMVLVHGSWPMVLFVMGRLVNLNEAGLVVMVIPEVDNEMVIVANHFVEMVLALKNVSPNLDGSRLAIFTNKSVKGGKISEILGFRML